MYNRWRARCGVKTLHTEWTVAARFNITAELIRNLSVLISYLEWVTRPGDGNHAACSEASKILARTFDKALDAQLNVEQPCQPVLEHSNNEAALTSEEDNMMLDPHNCDSLLIDSEAFLEWSDSVDWNNTRGC